MIKGIFLKTKPEMVNISESEVLGSLDLLKVIESPHNIDIDENNKIEKAIYYSDNYYITIFKFTGDNLDYFYELCKPYKILQNAWPELIKTFKYQDNKLIYATPRYNTVEDKIYKKLIEELIRFISFTYFMLKNGESISDIKQIELMTTEYVKEYIKFTVSISIPNNKL